MQNQTDDRNQHFEQPLNHSLLELPGFWRASETDTHPDDCDHPHDARVRYGKTDSTGSPVLWEHCTECGIKTDRTLDGVSRTVVQP